MSAPASKMRRHWTVRICIEPEGHLTCDSQGPQGFSLRVHVLKNWVLRVLVIVNIVHHLGKYMIIRYLDPRRFRV